MVDHLTVSLHNLLIDSDDSAKLKNVCSIYVCPLCECPLYVVRNALIKIENKKYFKQLMKCVIKWRRNLPFGSHFYWHLAWMAYCTQAGTQHIVAHHSTQFLFVELKPILRGVFRVRYFIHLVDYQCTSISDRALTACILHI